MSLRHLPGEDKVDLRFEINFYKKNIIIFYYMKTVFLLVPYSHLFIRGLVQTQTEYIRVEFY